MQDYRINAGQMWPDLLIWDRLLAELLELTFKSFYV